MLQVLFNRIQAMASQVVSGFLPNLLMALFVLGAGWLLALLIRRVTIVLVRMVGLDVFFDRLGLSRLQDEGRLPQTPSQLTGTLAYGLVLLSSLLVALDTLGLDEASILLHRLVEFLPRLLISLVMFVIGTYAVDFVVRLVDDLDIPRQPALNRWLPWIVRAVLMSLVVLAVLEQLGTAPGLITIGFAGLVGSTALTCVLAFGLGGRVVVANLLAGISLRLHLQPGMTILWNDRAAMIKRIGPALTELAAEDDVVFVPNQALADTTLQVQANAKEKA